MGKLILNMTDNKIVGSGDIELEKKVEDSNFEVNKTLDEGKEESDGKANIESQLELEGQEMMITNLFVDKPCTVLLSGIFFLFLVTILSAALGYFEVMPSNNREYLVWSDQKVKDWDM